MTLAGVILIALAVASRLSALGLYRRISESPSRDVTPSRLPGTPWFRVPSDQAALKLIVVATYASLVLGMLLVLFGVLA